MLRRVGVLGVEESVNVPILVLGEALAKIQKIDIADSSFVPAVHYIVYDNFDSTGVVAYCTPGANLAITVTVYNDGIDGDIFIRVTAPETGEVLLDVAHFTPAGGSWKEGISGLNMPPHDHALTVEVGH